MATPSDLSSYDSVLKRLYPERLVEMMVYKDRPLTGLMTKKTDYGGKDTQIPVQFANPQGRSHTFSKAQANVTDAEWRHWNVVTGENHSLAHVTSKDAARSKGDRKAYVRILKNAVDSAKNSLADSIEGEIPRDGSGSLGQVSSSATVGNQTIALENAGDVVNFEFGMTLVAAATAGGSVRSGTEVVAAVDRKAGEITATAAAWDTNITALAQSDYLFVDGDAPDSGSDKALVGWQDWLPSTDPSSGESFFGMDRSVDSRLYGVYEDLSSATTLEEALIDHESKICQYHEGKIDHYAINNAQMRRLKKELGAKKEYQSSTFNARGKGGEMAKISYSAVSLQGEGGEVKVFASHKVPTTAGFGLKRDTWELGSIGELVRFDDTDGNRLLRRANASGVEARIVSWGQVVCKAPGYNGQSKLPSVS